MIIETYTHKDKLIYQTYVNGVLEEDIEEVMSPIKLEEGLYKFYIPSLPTQDFLTKDKDDILIFRATNVKQNKQQEKNMSNTFMVKITGGEVHSKEVQEILFSMGYRWMGGYAHYQFTDRLYLVVDDDMQICYSDTITKCMEGTPVYQMEVVTKKVLKPVPIKKISVADGRYSADELRKFLEEVDKV